MKRSTYGSPSISAAPLGFAALAALATTFGAARASATGMQGHMYMAQCAAEQAEEPRLRAVFDAHAEDLANGTFFPDSGYTSDDHDQGEIPHWEQYIEGYVELIRERYPAPYDSPEARKHVAFLMGMAAHGITDSTFDSLLFERAEQVDPGDPNSFDMAMDIFLVHDRPRYYVPALAFDANVHADIFNTKILHPVTPAAIEKAMSTAWSGISVVAKYLYLGADDWGKKFPWARASLLDARTPGGYPFGARVTGGYYRELLRRLDGDTSADNVVIGSYPDDSTPLVTLDNTRPDGKIVLFFGEGIDRASLDDNSVVVADEAGNVVPTTLATYRGDKWANVVRVTAQAGWAPATKYTATLRNTVKTLHGVAPTKDIVLSFTTCTPTTAGGDCAVPTGAAPPSPCPKLDAMYAERPEDQPPEEEDPPPPVNAADPNASSGCAAAPGDKAPWAIVALAAASGALVSRSRRRAPVKDRRSR
jgi:hypothetical protein